MTQTSATQPSVIEQARMGHASEFARLYAPMAYAMARKRGLNEHDAADIMQQTMLEVLKLLPGFQYDRRRGTFKGLLKKIVSNRTSDLLRRENALVDDAFFDRIVDPSDAFETMFEREWLKSHVSEALDRVQREVKPSTFRSFQLYFLQEKPIEQVCKTLGMTRNQVSQNKRRILQRLRTHMEVLIRDTG